MTCPSVGKYTTTWIGCRCAVPLFQAVLKELRYSGNTREVVTKKFALRKQDFPAKLPSRVVLQHRNLGLLFWGDFS
ncbi:hypothetical protein IV203_025594 [Nitzschia inconspicua]|uniref:Uncharacterized protein n=1 Tax=Nitzschia inconspicua TaxID=303405 RepID=A0A9K3LH61_9STRA|nr:hypothetical protein IV203_025594 [Nitzschia inconspicua]